MLKSQLRLKTHIYSILFISGCCPEGTTLDRGYDLGRHTNSTIDFSTCDLLTGMYHQNVLCIKLSQGGHHYDQQLLQY